jgi:anti-sigma factor RsiW
MSEHEELRHECPECEQLIALMSDYLDSEETVEMRRELMAHIHTCGTCARVFWTMKRVVAECRCEERVDVPSGVHQQLWQVLVREIRVRREGPAT